jgi:exodeoxyribonuclease VII large subunit
VNQVRRAVDRLTGTQQRLIRAGRATMERMRARFQPAVAQLDALSPLQILGRGYSLTRKLPDRELVRNARQLAPHDRILLTFASGGATAAVESIEETTHGGT